MDAMNAGPLVEMCTALCVGPVLAVLSVVALVDTFRKLVDL